MKKVREKAVQSIVTKQSVIEQIINIIHLYFNTGETEIYIRKEDDGIVIHSPLQEEMTGHFVNNVCGLMNGTGLDWKIYKSNEDDLMIFVEYPK